MGLRSINFIKSCEKCSKRKTCQKPCDEVEKYFRKLGIYAENWTDNSYFPDNEKRKYATRRVKHLKESLMNRRGGGKPICPNCFCRCDYFRRTDKKWVCRCGWEGNNPEKKEKPKISKRF